MMCRLSGSLVSCNTKSIQMLLGRVSWNEPSIVVYRFLLISWNIPSMQPFSQEFLPVPPSPHLQNASSQDPCRETDSRMWDQSTLGNRRKMQKTLFLFQLTEDNEADEHDVYCELPDGGLDVPLPVQGTFVKVGIKISFRLEKILPLDRIFHVFGRPERCEGSTKCHPASLEFSIINMRFAMFNVHKIQSVL